MGDVSVAVRTSGEPTSKGMFCVPSASMPGEVWYVLWICEGTCWCGCPRFALRAQCRHVEQVALAIEIEARQLGALSTPNSRAEAASRLARIEEEFAR